MATADVDKACCVNGDGALFLLDKFLSISEYCGRMFQLLSFIYVYGDENLFIHNICPIKTNLVNKKTLEAKIVTEYATAEGGKLHAC